MSHLSRRTGLIAALAFAAVSVPALAGAPMEGPERYVVVDVRVASGVAATLDAQQSALQGTVIGRSTFIGQGIEWYDGRICDFWTSEDGAGPDPIADDPSLADLAAPIGGDAPGFVPVTVTCRDEPFVNYVRIDDRVLIGFVPNGTLYVVMERATEAEDAAAIQQALADRGLYDGPVDGVIDAEVRSAVAAFVAREAGPHPVVGILSRAVLDALLPE